jgi:hypothetical protein
MEPEPLVAVDRLKVQRDRIEYGLNIGVQDA